MGKKEGEIEGGNSQSLKQVLYIYIIIYIYTCMCNTHTYVAHHSLTLLFSTDLQALARSVKLLSMTPSTTIESGLVSVVMEISSPGVVTVDSNDMLTCMYIKAAL